MLKSTFWTQRRFAGFSLIVGCLLFLLAAGLIPRDAQGHYIVNLPLRAALLVIATQTTLAQWSMSLFICGVIVTALGFALLTRLLWDSGEHSFSSLALIASWFGTVLVVIFLAFRLGVDPLAAQETARTGAVPAYYEPLQRWGTTLFQVYTVCASSALALYGGALLVARLLPRWLSWTAIIYGLLVLALFAYAHDLPPFLHYLLPIVVGILLLRRRDQVPTASHRQEGAVVARAPMVEQLEGHRAAPCQDRKAPLDHQSLSAPARLLDDVPSTGPPEEKRGWSPHDYVKDC
jgi:hypothetical protein